MRGDATAKPKTRLAALTLLWMMGAFASVLVEAQSEDAASAGVASGTPAQQSVLIDSIHYVGNTKFSQAELQKVTSLRAGDTLSGVQLKKDLDAIVALYQSKGYDASVKPNITHPASGHVVVQINVNENGNSGDSVGASPPPEAGEPGAPSSSAPTHSP